MKVRFKTGEVKDIPERFAKILQKIGTVVIIEDKPETKQAESEVKKVITKSPRTRKTK